MQKQSLKEFRNLQVTGAYLECRWPEDGDECFGHSCKGSTELQVTEAHVYPKRRVIHWSLGETAWGRTIHLPFDLL